MLQIFMMILMTGGQNLLLNVISLNRFLIASDVRTLRFNTYCLAPSFLPSPTLLNLILIFSSLYHLARLPAYLPLPFLLPFAFFYTLALLPKCFSYASPLYASRCFLRPPPHQPSPRPTLTWRRICGRKPLSRNLPTKSSPTSWPSITTRASPRRHASTLNWRR